MLKKYVLTGGPCSGKTETLLELAKKGYYHLNEVARYLITQERKKPGREKFNPSDDICYFQRRVLETQVEWENNVFWKVNELFTDRGILDGIAFLKADNEKVFPELEKAARESNYSKIFYLDMLKNYTTDEFRKETKEEAIKIHRIIGNVYKRYDYSLIKVPEMNIEDRVKLILKEIRNNHSR